MITVQVISIAQFNSMITFISSIPTRLGHVGWQSPMLMEMFKDAFPCRGDIEGLTTEFQVFTVWYGIE